MTIFNDLTIKNLRGINELKLDNFKQFNLIVGNNDVGKTTILEALYLCINPNNPALPLHVNAFRGITIIDNQYWKSLFLNYQLDNSIDINTTLFDKHILQVKPEPIIETNDPLKIFQKNPHESSPARV